jgi:hypothetical protein
VTASEIRSRARLVVPLAVGVLFSLFWLLAADLLDAAPGAALAEAYGSIGAASIAGGMAGSGLARLLAARIEPARFLSLGALALVAAVAAAALAQRRFPQRRMTAPAGPSRPSQVDMGAVLRQPYGALLLATGMAASLVGMLVEFQFDLAAATSGADGRANARFFGGVYLALNAIALVAQVGLLPRLQRRIGVNGSLLVLPLALLGGSAGLLASAWLLAPPLLRISEGSLRSSIHRVNWEQAYLPLARQLRASAKLLVDGVGARVAEGVAALVMLVWLRVVVGDASLVGRDTGFFAWLLLAATLEIGPHSDRSATSGSTVVARSAGSRFARTPTETSVSAIPTNTSGSAGLTNSSVETRRGTLRSRCGAARRQQPAPINRRAHPG